MAKNMFFIPGGPGMNSNPERLELTDKIDALGLSCYFWNEPSKLRPEDTLFQSEKAYSYNVSDINKKIEQLKPKVVIASSFGARMCLDLVTNYKVDPNIHFIFVCPSLDMMFVRQKMISFSKQDFFESDKLKFQELNQLSSKIQTICDVHMEEAMGLVWQNPRLATHYFVDQDKIAVWARGFVDPKFSIDFESSKAVMEEFKDIHTVPPIKPLKNKLNIIFGEKDLVVNKTESLNLSKRYFENVDDYLFEGVGHFPQLEQSEKFISVLKDMIL